MLNMSTPTPVTLHAMRVKRENILGTPPGDCEKAGLT
jgi:hypothetical protein